jgi:small-conductance mechanosensitive channel
MDIDRGVDSCAGFELDEYKEVINERRFVMTRYMQALALYLALSGFAAKELINTPSLLLLWLMGAAFTLLNGLAIYAAGRFRSMADRAMSRESELALRLNMQEMHDLSWGHRAGVLLVVLDELAVISIVAWKIGKHLVD